MESIQTFLSTNYLYVIGGGAFLLIVLIGLLSKKSKTKDVKAEKTVDFKDVKTGNITDVVDVKSQSEIKPVEVTSVPSAEELKPVTPEVVEPAKEVMIEQPAETMMPLVEEQPLIMPTEVKEEPTTDENLIIVDPLASFESNPEPVSKPEEVKKEEPLVDYFSMANDSTNNEENK